MVKEKEEKYNINVQLERNEYNRICSENALKENSMLKEQ